jgi:hypothetical protein
MWPPWDACKIKKPLPVIPAGALDFLVWKGPYGVHRIAHGHATTTTTTMEVTGMMCVAMPADRDLMFE